MHLLVLSAFRRSASQAGSERSLVSMHLLVLSAFRPATRHGQCRHQSCLNAPSGAQCFPTSHVSVFAHAVDAASQCTFWCSVLSDRNRRRAEHVAKVLFSMLLVVLTSLRPQSLPLWGDQNGLNAPSGAQCFPTGDALDEYLIMCKSQCTFWCSVLSDKKGGSRHENNKRLSQCTFWCSVLSDSAPRKPRHNAVCRNEIAADLESATSNRPAPVQLNHTTAKNRHKTTQRRRRPLPASTPPTFNEPKPKNRRLTITSKLTSSYWASRIPCCKVTTILPAEEPIQVYTEIKITRKHQIENQQHRIGDWVLLCVNDAETHTRLIKG